MRITALITIITVTLGASDKPPEISSPYTVTQFVHEPGLYYENVGQLQLSDASWKLVIITKTQELKAQYEKLQERVKDGEKACETYSGELLKDKCKYLAETVRSQNEKLITAIELLTTYEAQKTKRGLVDVIGTISKKLFGTMDADDEKVISEQLEILTRRQQTLQHVAKNQLKVINSSIGHIQELEETIKYHEKVITNATKLLSKKVDGVTGQVEMTEHFYILRMLITDLLTNVQETMEFIAQTKLGIKNTRMLPVSKIIEELKEATAHLEEGTYFPSE
ncbi:uncharacterized protein [Cardiocondyla obscurior]|uniref:uncharacterized protein n=1 Tax=Cardiocondyla obscurior TaxID=286306 RepID=UPI0039657F2C